MSDFSTRTDLSIEPSASNDLPLIDASHADDSRIERGWVAPLVLWAVALVSIGCWWALHRWYGLLENRNNTHFAFEKIPGQFESPTIRRTLALFIAVSVLYAVGYGVIQRARIISWPLKLGIAAAILGPGVINILLYPVGALDVFNYLIEIKLTYHYNINPYLETFVRFRTDSYALPAFLVDSYLFYGPVWLLVSWLPGAVVGYTDFLHSLVAMKLLNAGLLLLTALAIFYDLRREEQPNTRRTWLAVYLFLANPLVLFEGLANAHNDVMMTTFLVGALVALRGRSAAAGALLAASALVKFFTGILAPLMILVAIQQRWGIRRIAATVALTGVTVFLACAPFWADGKMVDGLREGTKSSQEMNHVSIYSLAQQYEKRQEVDRQIVKQPFIANNRNVLAAQPLESAAKARLQRIFGGIFAVAALILLIGVKRGRSPIAAATDLLMLFSLLLTNLYAWYLIPVFAVLALRRRAIGTGYIFLATMLGLAYYPAYVWAHFNSGWEKFHVHLFLALFLTAPMLLFLVLELGQWVYGMVKERRGVMRVEAGSAMPVLGGGVREPSSS